MQDIEYLLKFTLDSATLKLDKINDISNSVAMATFRKKFADVKTIKAFTREIGKATYFPIFNVPLEKGKTVHRAKYCEIAIGESVFVSKEYAKILSPPDHFDSFIINEDEDLNDVLVDNDIDIKQYSYVIKDQSRILPLYDVEFEYDEELERKSKGVFICERCKVNQSISFCPSERANFCEKCDEDVHVDEFHKRHDRYYFNQVGKKRFIYCKIHPTTMVDYYCDDCMLPVCSKCKINGNHSEPPFSSHPLIKYLEACDKLQDLVKVSHSEIQPIKEQLEGNAVEFKERVYSFKEKINEMRNKIENEYKLIMNSLKTFESEQIQIINAHYIDVVRRDTYLSRLQTYPESLESSQLVRTFRSVMTQFNDLNISTSVDHKPKEVELKGRLTLGEPLVLTPRQGYSPRMEKSTNLYLGTRGTPVSKTRDAKFY
ncbi:Tripartite motif-containing protein 45 [Nosema granulosis]|uniref:Tripartite motif-containing protein 45 n=1 Tax=Nosema granulosis TaxID=83296 RepID=A0A9P6L011_9MICR|nr:Tripartite motif-containing protein 45 [Nosema granulosis]